MFLQYLDGVWSPLEIVLLVLSVVKLAALVDAGIRPAGAYVAADKLTKQGWLLILGLMFVADLLLGGFGILGFIGIVAALVYFVDVRPALSATRR